MQFFIQSLSHSITARTEKLCLCDHVLISTLALPHSHLGSILKKDHLFSGIGDILSTNKIRWPCLYNEHSLTGNIIYLY